MAHARVIKITLPDELAAKGFDVLLLLEPDEGPQSAFDSFSLGARTTGLHGIAHQLVVNDDVGTHGPTGADV